MPTDYDRITVVRVNFSEEEWAMLENYTEAYNAGEYIHDVVMRNLRRKTRKTKKENEHE